MKQLYTSILLVLLALLGNLKLASAQTFTEQAGISLTGLSGSNVAWGDYDNDGDLDVLLTGVDISGNLIAKIYRNNGDGTFTAQTSIVLQAIVGGTASWGDFNNDGYLDILLSGESTTACLAKVFRNNGDNTFTEQTSITFTGVCNGNIAWGDYNNDGYLDILLTGEISSGGISKIYKNNGDNTFSEQVGISLTSVRSSSVAWGDYDNDGYLDILITGIDISNYSPISIIYHNNGDGTFTKQSNISLTPVQYGSVAWGDYDNDGYLDILITGKTDASPVSKIYHNNQDGTFTEQTGISLTGVYTGNVAWGDYDNDGYLDILLTGTITPGYRATKIYHNNGDGTFTELTGNSFPNIDASYAAWGDYDNDGDLDFLLSGDTGAGYISKIYKNNTISGTSKTLNNASSVPTNLSITTNQGGNVTFSWSKATDTETPQNGLSYNLYVYENGQSTYVRSPQAFNQSNVKNGRRLVAKIGDIRYSASGYTLKGIASGNYKWSVQAVDGGLKGGLFAAEQSFNVVNLNKVGVNVANSQLTYTSADIEYSFNSTDGITGTWAPCSSSVTAVNFGTGGFDVWVREIATPSNKRKVATIAVPVTPAFTIDYINEKTTQVIADTVEVSVNADMSSAVSGTGTKIAVTPGQNQYFRIKASAKRVISNIQALIVPSRTTPTYSIDYANAATYETAPATDEYSINADMSSASSGTGAKVGVTPGQNLYFRSKATATNFKSLVETLVVPVRPATPAYSVDFVNETTVENVAATVEYSATNTMSGSTQGTGLKVSVTPGQNIYFRVKATSAGFASLVQTLSVASRPPAPIAPVVNDAINTFDWTNNVNFPNATDYEYSTDNGATWIACTVKPVNVENVAIAAGSAQVRVKAVVSVRFCSIAIKSATAFNINTGINDLSTMGINVYPNPVSHILVIENIPEQTQATIWSAEGKFIIAHQLKSKIDQIDVTDLPNGLYILILKNKELNAEARFVKQ